MAALIRYLETPVPVRGRRTLVIAVTGGIATGKSTVCRLLSSRLGASFRSCDSIVHGLYRSAEVIGAIRQRFGDEFLTVGHQVDRAKIGRRVFSHPHERRWLEDLFHPRVLDQLQRWIESEPCPVYIAEIPLLYEVDFPLNRDIDVMVASSEAKQIERLWRRDGLDPNQGRQRIAVQMPIPEKIARASTVIWNEGSESCLARLIDLSACRIQTQTL